MVTSVVTETVRPTWTFTEVVFTDTVTSERWTSLSEVSPQGAESTETAQLQSSLQSVQVDTTSPVPVPISIPPTENPSTRSAGYWSGISGPLTVQTSWESVSSPSSSSESTSSSSLESSSSFSSPTLLTTPSSLRPSVLSSISKSTSASSPVSESQSSTSPVTASPTSPFQSPISTSLTGLGPDSSPTQSPSGQSHHHTPSTGVIVGSAIGGAAVVALIVLTCILFYRHRRTLSHRRQASRQRLLPTSASMSSINGFHGRRFSQPLPVPASPVIPSAQVFHPRRYSNPAIAATYPNPSYDMLYPYSQAPHNLLEDPFTDPEYHPLNRSLSPIIEVSPPTRTASIYSRSSWDGALKAAESHESTQISPYNYNYPSQSTLTLETSGSSSRYPNTLNSSRRSDPFDLEPPPNTLQWPLPFQPHPSH